jgi:hypothetical protein
MSSHLKISSNSFKKLIVDAILSKFHHEFFLRSLEDLLSNSFKDLHEISKEIFWRFYKKIFWPFLTKFFKLKIKTKTSRSISRSLKDFIWRSCRDLKKNIGRNCLKIFWKFLEENILSSKKIWVLGKKILKLWENVKPSMSNDAITFSISKQLWTFSYWMIFKTNFNEKNSN